MIIVGLGNPGNQYTATRHNLGFRVVEALARALSGVDWRPETGVRWIKLADHWLIEPYEFMNNSGESLKKFSDWKELPIEPARLLVIHDDIDLPVGTIRPDTNRSSGGHHGVQSIIDVLHSQAFDRLRLGIGSNRVDGIPAEAYVLQRFSEADGQAIDEVITKSVQFLRQRLAV